MSAGWCHVCCTLHDDATPCPGPLDASEPEAVGWRVNVCAEHGMEGYGVLLAPVKGLWRARILTFPRALWVVPGGDATMKFIGDTAQEAKHRAVRFIRDYCDRRGYEIDSDAVDPTKSGIENRRAPRRIHFHPVRFGIAGASESGGTSDLSSTGMFIITSDPLECGTRVHISIEFPDRTLPLRGVVRWRRTKYSQGRAPGMGVQIESPPEVYTRYVDGNLSG